jgi:hypothetical protein
VGSAWKHSAHIALEQTQMVFSTTEYGVWLISFDQLGEVLEENWREFRAMWTEAKAFLR